MKYQRYFEISKINSYYAEKYEKIMKTCNLSWNLIIYLEKKNKKKKQAFKTQEAPLKK